MAENLKKTGSASNQNQPEPKEQNIEKETPAKQEVAAETSHASSAPSNQNIVLDASDLKKLLNKDDKGNKHQSYGLTVDEMKDIKEQQSAGEIKMIPANKVSRHMIPEYEKNLMHVSIERVEYDQTTGVKKSRPRIVIKTVEDFEKMSQSVKQKGQKANPENAFAGYTVVILHDPRTSNKSTRREPTQEEQLNGMTEEQLREVYFRMYGEEPLPSDSRRVLLDFINEKIQKDKIS